MPAVSVMFPVGALLAGVILEVLLSRVLSSKAKGWLAFICSLGALGGVFVMWSATSQGLAVDVRLLQWQGPISLCYHVDGLGRLFALAAVGIGAVVLLYSISYMAEDRSATRFYVLMLVFIAGFVHLVYAADLFVMYLSWEVIGLCSFLLVGFWYKDKNAAYGARKVLVMTHLAGYGLLAAVLVLYARTGSTLWTDPGVHTAFSSGLFLLMLLAAVAKSVQFPLHTWIPDAMAAPTPVSALLHAACYVKAGVYLVARMHSFGAWPVSWQLLVIWIGTVTMVVGVLYAMVQHDLKRLLAFHTVSQIGYMMLGLGLSTSLGIAAGLFHCLNHGLFKGGLFLCAGAVQKGTGTRDMDRLGGLGKRMPATMAAWLVGAGAISGVPLLSGFVSKWLIYNAALEAGQVIPALLAWIVSVFTLFSFLKATSAVFLADEGPDSKAGREAPKAMIAGSAVLAVGSVVIGVAPQLVVNQLLNPMLLALGFAPSIQVSWTGLAAGSGSWFSTAGLIMVVLSIAAGLFVFWVAAYARGGLAAAGVPGTLTSGVFSGGDPLPDPARVPSSDFSLLVKQSLAPFYRLTDVDSLYLGLWHFLLRLCDRLQKVVSRLEDRASAAILVLALIVAGLAAAFSPAAVVSDSSPVQTPVWPIQFGAGLACAALLFIGYAGPKNRRMLPLWAAAGILSVLGLGIETPIARMLCFEGAAFIALALIWGTSVTRAASRIYLLTVLLSAFATAGAMSIMGRSPAGIVAALLVSGFALKLAFVPLSLWLPIIAEAVPAPLVGLVVAVVDVAVFGELLALRQASPWIFTTTPVWTVLALLSALGGAALMLAQRDIKRMLAFSAVEDMGYILLGVIAAGRFGMSGAVLGLCVHALGKALLFGSLATPESDGSTVTLDSRGLASRYPWSAAGFLVGSLAMIGVPPLGGFAARWQLYATAYTMGPAFLGVFVVATILSILAYVRSVALCWWGPAASGPHESESALTAVVVAVMCAALLLIGLWPRILL